MHENCQRQYSHQQIKAKLTVFSVTHLKNRYKEPADRPTNTKKNKQEIIHTTEKTLQHQMHKVKPKIS